MLPRIGVFSYGRTQSKRCPNKNLRPFAGTTLTDIVLSKLARCGNYAFYGGYEEEFKEKCDAHDVAFIQRSYRSVTIDDSLTETLSFLKEVDCDRVLLVASCSPFLRLETIQAFLADCIAGEYQAARSVRRRQKHFMTANREAVNWNIATKNMNTQAVEPLFELMDALYFFEPGYLYRHGVLCDWRTVRFIEVPDRDVLIDIDTEEDFALAEELWKAGQNLASPQVADSRA